MQKACKMDKKDLYTKLYTLSTNISKNERRKYLTISRTNVLWKSDKKRFLSKKREKVIDIFKFKNIEKIMEFVAKSIKNMI